MSNPVITKVSGPLVVASGMRNANMYDVVKVSDRNLIGEIIEMHGDKASIQVYEETSGLRTGEEVRSTGEPLSVELGPGLLRGIFDGIQRPLDKIMEVAGSNLSRGIEVPSLDREKLWSFYASVDVADDVSAGDIIGTVEETDVITHKIMVPPGVNGTVTMITSGEFKVDDTVCLVVDEKGREHKLSLMQKWPVRKGRP